MKRVQVNKTSKLFFLNVLLLSCASANASDVESSFYGSLRLGADYVDSGTSDDAANGRDYLSRIGVKAEVQLADGLTGVGKVEYGLRGDDGVNFNQNQKAGMRQIYVGLKGKFGTVTYGSQTIIWHQYVRSAYFSDGLDSLRQGAIRDDDMLQWQKTYNNWKFGAAIQTEKQDGDSIDQYQVAAQYKNQKLKLQAALAADQQGENTGNLYGFRAWYDISKAFTVSAFYHLAEEDFDLYKGNSSGNVRLVSAEESGKVGGVTACVDEDRSTVGLYGKWRQDNNQVHARYAVNSCDIKGDVSSIKVEYIRYFSKKFRMWASFEQLDNDTTRLPSTGEDMSEAQVGVRFDF
ncbi:porin [Colwellia psychrerythraea]|uniref:Porin n=1 Tax=Colwellia psychrerythraea (strain 34H / ATCC BAA-681) TaxID=167879 RepID=Q483M6_COLP3|nr:porin [Colwellia psychrerythraea]AAZ25147.1 porin [Colwellia psychrerythraea 34H]